MKGMVFNLLQSVICSEFGETSWDELLDAAGLEGAYTSLGNYPDAELGRLVAASATRLELPPEEVLRWFGRKAMPILATRYMVFFSPHSNTRSFLLTLNDIIHPEVNKLYPGAITPVFDFDTSSDKVLLMAYRSQRQLCALAHGFVEGAADHFHESAEVDHVKCIIRGDDRCLFRLTFSPLRE